jgi:hypothetical protein
MVDAVCANEMSAADVRDLNARLEALSALLDRMMASLSDAETAAVDRLVDCLHPRHQQQLLPSI